MATTNEAKQLRGVAVLGTVIATTADRLDREGEGTSVDARVRNWPAVAFIGVTEHSACG